MKPFALLLLAALTLPAFASVVPTDFAVSSDKSYFQPVEPLHAGDRLQVQSPFLHEDDLVALGRCLDPDCTRMDIVRVWTSHRRHEVRDYVNIQHDGKYIFFAQNVPWALPGEERRGCFRAAPLRKVCSGSQRMAIIDAKDSPDVYRVRFSSDSWFWVRKIRSAT
jgi:hypothetical protein